MNKLGSYIISLFSFELLLVLFLNAGRYKGDPRFAWVPVDLTALFLVLSVAVAAYIVIYKDLYFVMDSLKLNFIYFIFVGYVIASYFWTPGAIYAEEKATYMATLVFWPLVATSIVVSSQTQRIKRFLFLLLLFSCWIAVETFFAYQEAGGRPVSALGGNYLGIGRVLGPAVLIILAYVLYFTGSLSLRLAGMAFIGFLLYLLFVVGGRGPLLATLIPILIPLIASIDFESPTVVWVKKSFYYMAFIVVVAIGSMIYMMNQEDAPETLRRLELLVETNDGVGGSAQARISYYATSIELWLEQPIFGYGVGSWPVLVEQTDIRGYPHNIILETLFEFGAIGMLLLIIMAIFALRRLGTWSTIKANPYRLIILVIFVNALLNAFVSGDIPDNRFLFATLGLMMLQDSPEAAEDPPQYAVEMEYRS